MPQPIVHYEIAAKDAKKLEAFYEGLFGWKMKPAPQPNYSMIDGKQGAEFGIYQVEGQDPAGVRMYANVDDAEAYMAKVAGLGGTVIKPAFAVPGGGIKIGIFTDPEGNVAGVVETLPKP